MKHTPSIVTKALDLYYEALTFKKIKDYLKRHHRVNVSRKSLWQWAKKYGKLVYNYTKEFKVDPMGRNLHCDEKWPKVRGKDSYLWLMGLGSPHYIIEMDLTRRRLEKYPRKMFRDVKRKLISYPPMIVSDGYGGYNTCMKYFYRKSKHIVYESFKKWPNNNRIERVNGVIDDWLRRRALKKMRYAKLLFQGLVVHHNFVREHEKKGITPAEGVGVHLPLRENKWLALIKLANRNYVPKR